MFLKKMGCAPSRNHIDKLNELRNNEDSNLDDGSQDGAAFDEFGSDKILMNIYDEEIIEVLKKDLNEKPEIFVLNNVLMATFFLENYKKEISEALKTRLDNSESFMEPDSIIEKANKNVIYRPLRGPKLDQAEALITKRVYVPLNDSIKVLQDFEREESRNENKQFVVKMEEGHRKGHVKLREVNNLSVPYDNVSQIEYLSVPSPTANGYSDSDTYSDTTSATSSMSDLRIPKPIINDPGKQGDYSINNCFVYRKVKKPDVDMDLEDLDTENLTDDDVYDVVSYLSSTYFMQHFQRNMFPSAIEKITKKDNYELGTVGWLSGKIFCNLHDSNGNKCSSEIIPCLKISWPEHQTLNFLSHKPETIWPSQQMLQEIKKLDCALVPQPYSRKNKPQPLSKDFELDWEMQFPLAEKYLDTYLSNAQLKCFLVLLTLHKEYIEPFTRQDGLLTEHIRHHVYWECESDPLGWAEHRLGFKLVSVIYNLSEHLKNRHLKDYFIKKRNLLKNLPRRYLEPSNEIFHNIFQSPLMFVIRALRNLRNKSGRFYPPLNFDELIKILKVQENSELANSSEIDNKDNQFFKKTKPPMFQDAEKQLRYVKMKEKKQRMLEKIKQQHELASKKNLRKQYYNIDVTVLENDDIDNQWHCEKSFDIPKKVAILKFFTQAFIDIAKVMSKIETNRKTLFYLKQAYYLTRILDDECAATSEDIGRFYKIIKQEESKCFKASNYSVSGPVSQKTLSSAEIVNNNHSNKVLKTLRKHSATKIISEEIHLEEIIQNSKNGRVRKISYSCSVVMDNQNIYGG